MAGKDGAFSEHVKDILLRKDELESDLENALEVASTEEELLKLSVINKKLQKHSKVVEEVIAKKLNTIRVKTGTVASLTSTEHILPTPGDRNGNSQVDSPKNDSGFEHVTRSSNSSSSSSTSASISQEDLDQENGRQGYYDGTGDNIRRHQQENRTHIRADNSGLTVPSMKNAADNVKLFIRNIGQLSEQQVRVYFERFGNVQQVVTKSYPDKASTAVVRFTQPDFVQKVLATVQHVIGRFKVYPEAFTDTPWVTKQRRAQKTLLPSYQVFCRGIPHAATSEVVKKALQCFTEGYTIRDVLMFRGFAFVDYEREVDAEYIIHAKHPIYILGKTVNCGANTNPKVQAGVGAESLVDTLRDVPATEPSTRLAAGFKLMSEQGQSN